jgi:hypothetical protein
MNKRVSYIAGNSQRMRQVFYENLNFEGQFFVDYLAERIMNGYRSAQGASPFGIESARELALALLEHCWDGTLPEKFPVLVEIISITEMEVRKCSQA